MKKVIISLLFAVGLCSSVFCAAKRPALEPIESESYSFTNGNFEYTNLPQYEMLAIACRIAGIRGFTEQYIDDYAYLTQISTVGEKVKDHKLIKLIQAASKKGVTCDGFVNLAYHIKPDFSSTTCEMDPKPESLNWEWQKVSAKEIYAIVNALHDFAKDTQFMRIRDLYRSDCIKAEHSADDTVTKYKLQQWAKEFFGYEIAATVNYSPVNVGYCFYDFATGSDGEEKAFITIYPGADITRIYQDYLMFYSQKYASVAWDTVKDVYKKYMTAYQKRINGDKFDPKNIESMNSYNLASIMFVYFFAEFAGYAYEEESPGAYEEIKNEMYKSFQDENLFKVFDLIGEYKTNRETYPTIVDFYPRMTEFILKLPVEE